MMNINLKKIVFVLIGTALLGSVFAADDVPETTYATKTTEFLEKVETRIISVDARNKVECASAH